MARRPLPRLGVPLIAGAVLTLAGLLTAVVLPGAMAGWLGAAVLFSAVPFGALYLEMMMRLIPGAWGEELRLSTEAATLLTPWAALVFLPVLIGMGAIYPWLQPVELTGLQQVMLSPAFFVLLTVVRFAALWWLGARMRRRRAPGPTAGGGLVLLPVLALLAAFVWLMSLDPKFASSAFGLQFLEREFMVAFCALLLLRLSIGRPPRRPGVLGGLLFTLLLLWAYIEFLPYFISYSSNLPDAAKWYIERGTDGWGALLWTWGVLSGVPLFALLFAKLRNYSVALRAFAAAILLGKACEMAWVTLPQFGTPAVIAFWLSSAGLALVGLALLPGALRRRIRSRMPKEAR